MSDRGHDWESRYLDMAEKAVELAKKVAEVEEKRTKDITTLIKVSERQVIDYNTMLSRAHVAEGKLSLSLERERVLLQALSDLVVWANWAKKRAGVAMNMPNGGALDKAEELLK